VWRDEVAFLGWILTAVDSISLFLINILVVIIVVGIMNSMWISVRERTREVGTLRAIGMTRDRVLLMFMLEALLLGMIASAIGSIAGAALAIAIENAKVPIPDEGLRTLLMSDTLHFVVKPGHIFTAVIAFTVVTAISALWPASRAAKLAPVTAIYTVA
jgi:putative ABC transport system permease protein